ncbi:THAP domain-containing protein 2 [Exaiptasia diaphana]|nr:THAP domain-containing protein 2 [Exaiptasia diaphana]
MVHCCVPECTNHSVKTESVSYHKIPNDQALQKAWLARIKRENLPNLKNCYVCSEHFESSCFEVDLMEQLTGMKRKRKLKKDAVPSVFSFSKPPAKRRATTENRLKRKQDEEVTQQVHEGEEKTTTKMMKVIKEGTIEEALDILKTKMPPFLQHVFIKRNQTKFFQEKIEECKPQEAIVHVDFSENYTCFQQDEVQTAHWNQNQVTVFPVAIWSRDTTGNVICSSHAIISDDLGHEKKSIAVFLHKVLNTFLKENHPHVTDVYLFSEGPSLQFKNKFMVKLLLTLNHQLGIRISWHYFATSHGKGAVDGIGASVKRSVWLAVSTRKVVSVVSAKAFAEAAQQFCTKIRITLITAKEMKEKCQELKLHECFDKATAIPDDGQKEYSEQSDCSSLDNEENDSDDTCKVQECLDKEDCKIPQFFDVDFCSTRQGYQQGILVQPGLPDHFCEVFCDVYSDFTVPEYYLPNIQSIVREDYAFHGNYLISNSDLVSLYAVDCVSNEF